jgi:hypothetical protein
MAELAFVKLIMILSLKLCKNSSKEGLKVYKKMYSTYSFKTKKIQEK